MSANTTSFDNIYYMGVARWAEGRPLVVASYSHNSDTDIHGVKQALNDLTITPGKLYSFSIARNVWNIVATEEGLVFILINALNYPQRVSYCCLEEQQRMVTS